MLYTLTDKSDKKSKKKKREMVLLGETYKIPCDPDRNLYITINSFHDNINRPFEIFVNSHGKDDTDVKTIAILLSALMRRTEDISFIINHLKKIESPNQGVWWYDSSDNRHYMNSVSKAISVALDMFIKKNDETRKDNLTAYSYKEITSENEKKELSKKLDFYSIQTSPTGDNNVYANCPKCNEKKLKLENGCELCITCGYSKCS